MRSRAAARTLHRKDEKMTKPVLAITMGDAAGIGAEITVKALMKPEIYTQAVPVVIGDRAAIADAIQFCKAPLELHVIQQPEEAEGRYGVIDLIDLGYLTPGGWAYKTVSALTGDASYQYVAKGIALAMEKRVHAVVTGPINKEAINLAGHHYAGHTEIFAKLTGTKDYAMLLSSDSLRVIHVTTHVSLREACDRVTTERVSAVIRLADEALRLMGVRNPRIAVAGLNAHCSENGLFGFEEQKWIIPAIQAMQAEGLCVDGPIPPDTVFVKALGGMYDIVVAMYHDQGHIPLKLSGFKLNPVTKRYESMSGINTTIGLPIIRTSVDHGTAFGKAGEGRANEQSMLDAIHLAVTMAKNKFLLA